MTIYNQDGVRVDLEDQEAIAIYIEEKHCATMTLEEWFAITRAIPTDETVKFDVFG